VSVTVDEGPRTRVSVTGPTGASIAGEEGTRTRVVLTAPTEARILVLGTGVQGPPGTAGPSGTAPVFSRSGTLAVLEGASRYYCERAGTVTVLRGAVGTAPTGAPIVLDVNVNGVSVFATPADRLSILPDAHTAVVEPVDLTVAAGDYLTVDVDSVGITTPGADLTVTVTIE
jgi:hypothetical protein